MASIKCGACKGTHVSVEQVRSCSFATTSFAESSAAARMGNLVAAGASLGGRIRTSHGLGEPTRTAEPATEKQVAFLRTLVEERVLPQDGTIDGLANLATLTKAAATAAISRLLDQPKREQDAPAKKTTQPAHPNVPQGHYATPSRTGNNDLDFWKVDRPTEGRWQGYTFVKRVIGGHPEFSVRGAEAAAALEAIATAGVEQAAQRYGTEIGRCYMCNRTLTDETSRALGIGPDCRSK
jgi:hypothetical protein